MPAVPVVWIQIKVEDLPSVARLDRSKVVHKILLLSGRFGSRPEVTEKLYLIPGNPDSFLQPITIFHSIQPLRGWHTLKTVQRTVSRQPGTVSDP